MDIEMNEVPLGRMEMSEAYYSIKQMYLARTEGYVEAKKKEGWVEYDIIEHECSIDNLEGRYLVAPEVNEQVAELCKIKKLQLPIPSVMKQITEGTSTPLEDEAPGSDSYRYDSELHELLQSLSTDSSKAISLQDRLQEYQSQIMNLLASIEDAGNRPLD